MTAAQPATPGSDSVRAQIAEMLAAHDWVWDEIQDERRCACGVDAYEGMEVHHADVLVPLVDRLVTSAPQPPAEHDERLTAYTCPRWHRDPDGWCIDERPHLAARSSADAETLRRVRGAMDVMAYRAERAGTGYEESALDDALTLLRAALDAR